MKITAILPVSRIKYLDRVLASLVNQTHKPNNLLVIYEGHESGFLEVRNRVIDLDFEQVRCIPSVNLKVADNTADRRTNISRIHNQIRDLIDDSDWLFSIEDDGILPPDALKKLVKTAKKQNVGMVTGVELGRWGIPYVGAWVVDNIAEIKVIQTLENKSDTKDIDKIDACGLYCGLIRADIYKQHTFFAYNGLGPDVNLGLYLRSLGYENYIDWSVHVTHLGEIDGEDVEIAPTDSSRVVKLTHLYGSTWQSSR